MAALVCINNTHTHTHNWVSCTSFKKWKTSCTQLQNAATEPITKLEICFVIMCKLLLSIKKLGGLFCTLPQNHTLTVLIHALKTTTGGKTDTHERDRKRETAATRDRARGKETGGHLLTFMRAGGIEACDLLLALCVNMQCWSGCTICQSPQIHMHFKCSLRDEKREPGGGGGGGGGVGWVQVGGCHTNTVVCIKTQRGEHNQLSLPGQMTLQ